MLKLEKVATPDTAAMLVEPASVPPPGFVPIATVTVPVNPLTVFPRASCAVTLTAGVIARPAVAFEGCTVNTSCAASPAVTLNVALGPGVGPGAAPVSVKPAPLLSIDKPAQ